MLIIKVSATDSTNLHLKRMAAERDLQDFTILVTQSQLQGRGQAGTKWISKPGKNLTFSVLKYFEALDASGGFRISQAVSLCLIQLFHRLGIPDLAIKWPNDILSGGRKICGILIENTLKGNRIAQAVIGMGINVNQKSFDGLPRAASLYLVTGREHDRDSLLDLILTELEGSLNNLNDAGNAELISEYGEWLYLKEQESKFEIGGQKVSAIIRGVSPEGKLQLQQGAEIREYGMKEVVYLQ